MSCGPQPDAKGWLRASDGDYVKVKPKGASEWSRIRSGDDVPRPLAYDLLPKGDPIYADHVGSTLIWRNTNGDLYGSFTSESENSRPLSPDEAGAEASWGRCRAGILDGMAEALRRGDPS